MKLNFLFILNFLFFQVFCQEPFEKYYHEGALRFDYLIAGNSKDVVVYPQQIKKEPLWAGPVKNLVDPFNYGTNRFRIFDAASGKLIFSKGFSTLFSEWQTTAEAKKTNQSFYHAAIFPFPKNKIRLEVDSRTWDGSFKNIYTTEIDPENYFILKESPTEYKKEVILNNGNPQSKVDLVILAEGYTAGEMDKFITDVRRVTEYLFSEEPFSSEKNKFNVTALLTPSAESGTDIPGESVYRNTMFNSTFYTFDTPRYLTTSDMKSVYDAISGVPCDQVYILVNTNRYGGGGFYNFINVCTSDHALTREVFIHEFGHGFGGLGDEYYDSEVAFENYYNTEVEPWEPNLTTLNDFDSKWKPMVHDSVPVPTPRDPAYSGITGAFEGGGYMSQGIYSPQIDCRMKSNQAKGFCPVCDKALKEMIRYYTE